MGVLNYFNILSLSKIYPNLFSSLPHKSAPLTHSNPAKKNNIVFFCPVNINPCEGKEIFKNKEFLGIGFKVDYKSKIFATITGDVIFRDENATQSSVLDTALIAGKDKAKGYFAIYDFIGTKEGDLFFRPISSGDILGTAISGTYFKVREIPEYKGINLIMRVQDAKGNILNLSPSDFQ